MEPKKGIARPYSSGCLFAESERVKGQNETVSWYRKLRKAAWLNGESQTRAVIDSAIACWLQSAPFSPGCDRAIL
jgi:hypothetical protein